MLVDSCIAKELFEAIDPKDAVFVSHAHSDHSSKVRNYSSIIASEETKELLEARDKRGLALKELPKGFELLDAGHILGSKQLYINLDGYSLLYSGDYQMEKPLLAKSIEIKKADILVMDSTYCFADFSFDERNEVIGNIQKYVRQKINSGSILFGAYAVGRAQELIKIMNEIGIVPTVSEDIAKIGNVYKKSFSRLYFSQYIPGDELKGNFVGIFTRKKELAVLESMAKNGKRAFTAVATGWAKVFRLDADVQFPLSDHADLRQALEYVSPVSPKLVVTIGQNAGFLAKTLNANGYVAKTFEQAKGEYERQAISNLAYK